MATPTITAVIAAMWFAFTPQYSSASSILVQNPGPGGPLFGAAMVLSPLATNAANIALRPHI